MKMLISGLLFLGLSVFLALAVKHDNGYILIGYGQWTVEGSLAFFLLLDLLLFALLYALLRFWSRLGAVPRQLRDWRGRRATRLAQRSLTRGLMELSEGQWKSAEKSLTRYADHSDTPLLNYLAAARSAQQQGAHERRDHYLQLAHESMPSADVAVGLTQAELQLAHEQQEQALATLKHLRQIAPRHAHVLKLLKELYERVGDWQELNQLLPELKRRKVIDKAELAVLELKVARNLLDAAAEHEPERLEQIWKGLSVPIRQQQELVVFYTSHLMRQGEQEQVEELLRAAIERSWSDQLVELYSRVTAQDGAAQLTTAEGWLEAHPNDPTLLLALGRLCLKNKLWGKARSYLEASIGAEPNTPAYHELGILLERMGETEQAMACFKAGLQLSSDVPLAELPDSLGSPVKLDSVNGSEIPTDINPPRLEVVKES